MARPIYRIMNLLNNRQYFDHNQTTENSHLPLPMLLPLRLHSLTPTLTIRIKIRPLTTPNSPIPASISQAHKIKSSTMESTPVIPDSNIVNVLPPEPDLEIMIVLKQLLEPTQEHLTLLFGDPVYKLAVLAHGVQRPPASDGVGADDWVDGSKFAAGILDSAARFLVKFEASPTGSFDEVRAAESTCQAF